MRFAEYARLILRAVCNHVVHCSLAFGHHRKTEYEIRGVGGKSEGDGDVIEVVNGAAM